jgi:ABC-type cobalamin/Fe3+-siderophores transport system ATPase subunit
MIATAAPKLRMLAGPNGSGKSTLFQYLRQRFSFPVGYCLTRASSECEEAGSGSAVHRWREAHCF